MSFINQVDTAVKSLVYNKFAEDLSLTDQNKDLVFQPKAIALREVAEKRAVNTLNFISVWRDAPKFDWDRQNTVAGRKGLTLAYSDEAKTGISSVRAIPVRLNYSIWFWSKDLKVVTDAVERYLFWLHTGTPALVFNYEGLYPLEMKFHHIGDTYDESPWSEQYNIGKYIVHRVDLALDAWILDSFSVKTILNIICDIYSRESRNGASVDELITTITVTDADV